MPVWVSVGDVCHTAAVTEEDFWALIADARVVVGDLDDTQGEAVADAITAALGKRPADDAIAFQARFDALMAGLYHWDLFAAAGLIGGGECSDDGFMDFRAGIIALGQKWYERVLTDPDTLADHPAVIDAATTDYDGAIFAEAVLYAASTAFEDLTGDDEEFESDPRILDAPQDDETSLGEQWDIEDDDEVTRRLPRLAALFLYSDEDD